MDKTGPEMKTEDRRLYDKGFRYLQAQGVIKRSRDAWQFFHDRQWEGLEQSEVFGKDGPPFINFIKPDVIYKTTTIGQRSTRIVFLPSETTSEAFSENAKSACEALTAYAAAVWENTKLDSLRWRAVRDAVVVGDGLIHFAGKTDENGEISAAPELIDSVNVFYGDENESDVQKQEYILISYRRPVSEMRKEAKENGVKDDEIETITSDEQTEGQANDAGDNELETSDPGEGKALVILKYWRGEDGKIMMRKSVSHCVIMPDKATGLSLYPIAKMSWEEVKNSARGNGIVAAQIPNQVEYNKTLARRAVKVMETAYPKMVYNESMIDNPDELDNVGAKIAIRGQLRIQDVIGYINPSTMSQDVAMLSEDLMKMTQEQSGASEAALGKVNPEKTSGRAIMAVQDASAQIMSLQMQQHEQFVEDIARILLEIWTVYTGPEGKIVNVKNPDGSTQSVVIDKMTLDNLKVNVKIEVSPTSTYSQIAVEQTLENYLAAKYITFEELVEALPEGSIAPKQVLKSIIQKRQQAAEIQAQEQAQAEAAKMAQDASMPQAGNMPPETQTQQGGPVPQAPAANKGSGVDPAQIIAMMQQIQQAQSGGNIPQV